jgi:DNA-directed RNA polymerase II subunit RPB1
MKKGDFDDVFCYELDDENWRPTYILPEYVDHLNTMRDSKMCLKQRFKS